MENQAVYAVAPAAIPAALAPYAALLHAEGFQVQDWAPVSHPSLYSTWEAAPQHYYFCDLAVLEGQVHAGLTCQQPDAPAFRLFHWLRVDAPEELRWLLQRSQFLRQARGTILAADAASQALAVARLGDSAGPS